MNIVVLDRRGLAPDIEFPFPRATRFGWEEYAETRPEEVVERCWRAQIVVTLGTPLTAAQIGRLVRLRLIAIAGRGCEHVDLAAARAQGVAVCNVPEPMASTDAARLVAEVVANIDAYLAGEPRNPVP